MSLHKIQQFTQWGKKKKNFFEKDILIQKDCIDFTDKTDEGFTNVKPYKEFHGINFQTQMTSHGCK